MAEEKTNGSSESGVAETGGSAGQLPGWTAGLSKEQKEALTSQKVQLPEKFTEFWDKHSQLEARLSKAVTIPEKDAPREVWDNYRKAIGVPETTEGYGLQKLTLREGTVYDKALGEAFAKKAHDLGLTVKEAQGLFDWQNELAATVAKVQREQAKTKEAESLAIRQRELEETRVALRTQWGGAFDSRLPRNMNALMNPVMMPQDIREVLDKSGILRKPSFHLWWDRQVSMMSSDRKLSIASEPGEGTEEQAAEGEATTVDRAGKRHLKKGFFKDTEKRFPARKKAV